MPNSECIKIESIEEEESTYSDDDLYNINSWGADLSFREITTMYDDEDLVKPELQRKYVWTRNEASRFIDSILLGLPVPSIFFAKEEDETMLIVDGYQRIMTVRDYMIGVFSGDGMVFKLANSDIINSKWRGKAFVELTVEEQRKIKMTTIHAIVFQQKYPNNDTAMYQIFERINTGGKVLKPQEIRNCVYQGPFNTLLFELNKDTNWRAILNLKGEDSRMLDLELILRFFAMNDLLNREEIKQRQINLSKYLNCYMGSKKNIDSDTQGIMKENFISVMEFVYKKFGNASFKNIKANGDGYTNKINPAVFDAVAVATSYVLSKSTDLSNLDLMKKYNELLQDSEFHDAASLRTTNIANIKKRISIATKILYGVEYDW